MGLYFQRLLDGTVDKVVSHMFYADDLCLMAKDQTGLNTMLGALQRYSASKGLTVNPRKSKVVIFNSRDASDQFLYNSDPLEIADEFKYLGVVFHKNGNMKHADKHMSRALLGAIHKVYKLADDHGVRKRTDMVLQLYQSYAVSVGLFGSHLWSTSFLMPDKVFSSAVQSKHLSSLRYLIGARQSTPSWHLLHDLGQSHFNFIGGKLLAIF